MLRKKEREYFWLYFLIGIFSSMIIPDEIWPQRVQRPDSGDARARALLARHDSASGRIGGRSRLKYTHSIFEMDAGATKSVMESWTITPNRTLTRTTMPGMGTTEVGYNGTVGWTTSPFTGAVLLEGEPLKLIALQAEGRRPQDATLKTLAAGARTVVEGKDVAPVTYDDGKGNSGTLYFDVKTGLMHAMRIDSSVVMMVFGDYKRIDGELFAMTTTLKGPGHTAVTRVTHLDHKAIDTTLFSPPPAVRALIKSP